MTQMQQKQEQHHEQQEEQEEQQEQQYQMKQQQQLLNRSKEIRIVQSVVGVVAQLPPAREPSTTVLNQQWIKRSLGRVCNE